MDNSKAFYPIVKLQKDKDQAVKRFHPWVFSGAVQSISEQLKAGDLVNVANSKDEIIATGFCEPDSIAVKILCFENRLIDQSFWNERINTAFELRKKTGLVNNPHTNCFRLVHSEGDGLPGLIIDIYGKVAVIQTQTEGMALHLQEISIALQQLQEADFKAIYNKSSEAMQRMNKEINEDGYLFGTADPDVIRENDLLFHVDWEGGQKTGLFIDQRENRALVNIFSKDKTVLNMFCYTGGFSVAALNGGAKKVVSVDSSKKAIQSCEENIVLNGFDKDKNPSVAADAKQYLKDLEPNVYDLIVLDPPAFAKNHHNRHKGLQAYKYINCEAIKKVANNGLLFTFSCSQSIDRQMFQSIVMAAAIEAKRNVKILYQLSQPADHPIGIFHPEGAYLKGLVLQVE